MLHQFNAKETTTNMLDKFVSFPEFNKTTHRSFMLRYCCIIRKK